MGIPRRRRLIPRRRPLIPRPCRLIPRQSRIIPCRWRLIPRSRRLIPPPMSVSMPLLRHFISRCIPPQPHCPIDGKSTLHRRKIHAPSTPLITGSTPLLYPPKRLASPTPHSHHRHRLPNFLLFFFSRILSHQFPIRSSPSTTISPRHTPSLTISFKNKI